MRQFWLTHFGIYVEEATEVSTPQLPCWWVWRPDQRRELCYARMVWELWQKFREVALK